MGTRTHLRAQKTSEIPVRSKRWSHTRKEEDVHDDEVVKHMSKLPGYLQGEEESNDVLNIGVLDWGRLEKWKHCRGKRVSKVSSTTLGRVVPNASSSSSSHHRCKIDDQVHASSLLGKLKASRALQQPSAHPLRCTLEPEFASSKDSSSYKQEIPTCSYNKSSSRKDTSGLLTEMGNSVGSLGAKESEKRAGEIHSQVATERGNQCANNKLDGEEEKTVGEENHQVNNNIVLLRSRKQFSGEPHKSSLDDNLKVTREVSCSLGLTSQVHLLSFDLERDSEDLFCKKERFGGATRHSRIVDQEKKRDTSPSKRFSFSFGRLSRSFTFKEDSSSAGQPSSDDTINNKSESMRFDDPSQSSNPEEEEEEEKHCGSRVSPLRRLLDHPLLKSKGSEKNLLPSSKERSTSSNPKQDTWRRRTRAVFQLTTRNGVPLFQFVVDDDNLNNNSKRSILGATMKNSSSAGSSFKDDTVQYCTFYSVNEVVKKKRSWLIHGRKDKQQQQRGFVYNVIGQMRLCNSFMSSDITEKGSENISSTIREAVLVDETEQVVKEVAAVVIKKKKKHAQENFGETTVIIPGGVHSFPEKGAPTPLVSRWRSGGLCDCGGWDVGCKLHVLLSNKTTLLHELDHHQSFKLFDQEESDQDSGGPVLEMTELKTGIYRVEFGSFLSHLQAFFVCVTVITCASEEETVLKTTGRSSSPFAPPLSPVGRV